MKERITKMEGERRRKKREVERVERGEANIPWEKGAPPWGPGRGRLPSAHAIPPPAPAPPGATHPTSPSLVPLTELLPESHTRLLRRWRVEARNGGFPERGDEASGCPEPERGG